MVICSASVLGPEFFSADPRLSALTTCGSFMGLPAIYYRIIKPVQMPQVVRVFCRCCGTFVYRVWKEGQSYECFPPEAVHATVRPTSELRPDFQGGSDLARCLPGLVCGEGKCCVERSTSTPLSECFDACGFIGASLQG